MKQFLVEVSNYEFGTRRGEYRIDATSFHTAIARGIKRFKDEGVVGKKRIKEIVVKARKI